MTASRKPFTVAGSNLLGGSELTEINHLAKRNLLPAVQKLLPGGEVLGKEYVVRNPTRADRRAGSFKICISGPKAGFWSDFATDAKGGGLVSLVAYVKSLSRRNAIRWLRKNIFNKDSNIASTPPPAADSLQRDAARPESASTDPVPEGETLTVLPPDGAEHPAVALKRMGCRLPDQAWPYRTAEGAISHYVLRWNEGDGSKRILPLSWVRSAKGEGWSFKAWPEGRLIYNLDKIVANRGALIIVCEGEKAADEAGKLYAHAYERGVVATTSSGGTGAIGKTDWTPLAGRFVRIWPDADEAGLKYASEVAKRLEETGCKVEIMDAMALAANAPTGDQRPVPEGWDAADATAEWTDQKALRNAINRSAKPYDPGPTYVSYGPYTMSDQGLTMVLDGVPTRISAPFEVLGESRNPGSFEWGKLVRFHDGDGKVHDRVVPNALLQGEPAILCSLLASEGLLIHPDQKRRLASYLAGVRSNRRVKVVMRTGWHEIEGRKYFVFKDETIGAKGSELVVLDASAVGPYETKGSLEGWIAGVGQMVADHFLPMLLVSTALSGPLLYLLGYDGGGLHVYGGSSIGKTTMLRLAASPWGRGSSSGGYVRAWSATRNGLEAAAASANDTVLIFDELSTLDAHEAGPAIYALANGSGKSRMARDTSLRETKRWRLLVVSSGEVAMATKVVEDKRQKLRAGQTVRMLDILADRGKGFGAFSSAGSFPDAGKLADACKAEAEENYGTAGPEFVRRIFRFGLDEAEMRLRERVSTFVEAVVPKGSDGQIIRVAKLLGLIGAGGDLATELDITPWKKGHATAAAKWAFQHWLAQHGGGEAAEIRQAVETVRLFIEQYGESRFDPLDVSDFRPAINRAGWRTGSGSTEQWLIPPETWKSEVCQGLDPLVVARTLAERRMLKRAKDGFQSVVKIEGTAKRVYVITARIFDGSTDDADAE
jgi:putative DNA primase/helicase